MIINKTLKKLKSQAGETIAEVLVALLISSVALIMLASMISSTNSMVTKSKNTMKDYYDANENLEKLQGSNDPITITISGKNGTETITISVDGVPCFKNGVLGKPVYAYGTATLETETETEPDQNSTQTP